MKQWGLLMKRLVMLSPILNESWKCERWNVMRCTLWTSLAYIRFQLQWILYICRKSMENCESYFNRFRFVSYQTVCTTVSDFMNKQRLRWQQQNDQQHEQWEREKNNKHLTTEFGHRHNCSTYANRMQNMEFYYRSNSKMTKLMRATQTAWFNWPKQTKMYTTTEHTTVQLLNKDIKFPLYSRIRWTIDFYRMYESHIIDGTFNRTFEHQLCIMYGNRDWFSSIRNSIVKIICFHFALFRTLNSKQNVPFFRAS